MLCLSPVVWFHSKGSEVVKDQWICFLNNHINDSLSSEMTLVWVSGGTQLLVDFELDMTTVMTSVSDSVIKPIELIAHAFETETDGFIKSTIWLIHLWITHPVWILPLCYFMHIWFRLQTLSWNIISHAVVLYIQ